MDFVPDFALEIDIPPTAVTVYIVAASKGAFAEHNAGDNLNEDIIRCRKGVATNLIQGLNSLGVSAVSDRRILKHAREWEASDSITFFTECPCY